MKYARQTQEALDRLDASLRTLRDLIKRGEKKTAIEYMENGSYIFTKENMEQANELWRIYNR